MKSFLPVLVLVLSAVGAMGGELQDAASRGEIEKVRSLIRSNPAAISARDGGTTALHEATRAGHLDIVKLLVFSGANVNAIDFSGLTPLKLALGRRNVPVADFLRQNGGLEKAPTAPRVEPARATKSPPVNAPHSSTANLFKTNPAPAASGNPKSPLTNVASTPRAVTNKPPTEREMMPVIFPIHEAARIGDVEQIKSLFKNSPDLIDSTDEKGRTPLHMAAANNQLIVAQVLLGLRAKVNAQTISGQTALHVAARLGDTSIAGLLITNRAAVNVRDTFGSTPLLVALQSANSETLDNPFIGGTKFGVTNSVLTAQQKQLGVVKLLVAHKADLNARNRGGATPLMEAVRVGNEPVVALLIQAGANANTSEPGATTPPLHLAAGRGQAGIVKALLHGRAAVNAVDARGDTPLCYALREGRANIATLLRQAGGTIGQTRPLSPIEKSLIEFYERTESTLRAGSPADKSRALIAMNPTKADTERMFPRHAANAWRVVEDFNRQIKQAFAGPVRDADVSKEIWRILPAQPSPVTLEWRSRGWLASDLPVLSLSVDKTGGSTRPGDYCFVNNHWVLLPPLSSIAAPVVEAAGRRK